MKENIFREYDIRGVYPSEVNEDVAYLVGRSYGSILQEKYNKTVCVIGRDNRLSSPKLHDAMLNGLTESGINVIDLGLCTTPMFFYGCIKTNNLGIMITASHNPKDDNGFKFSFDMLGNARGEQVYSFRDYTLNREFLAGNGNVSEFDVLPYYKSLFKDSISLGNRRLKVVIDPGNGTTSLFVKDIYNQFDNLDITYINDTSDATFPNHHPDPAVEENLLELKKKVLEVGADIGIAFDGDGDRVGFVDNNGNYIPTDKFMVIVLRHYFKTINDKRILYDVKCSKIVNEEAVKAGGSALLSRTGASYTRPNIVANKLPFGGEYSGHFVFNDKFPGFDSGMYSGLRMLEILSNETGTVNDLLEGITNYYNTPEIKIHADDNIKFDIINKVKEYCNSNNYKYIDIDGVRIETDNYWALIRASNTGPNLTLRFEARDMETLDKIKNEFTELINNLLNN